jgi:glycosyltransferase involved in cell wall biosynthesis
LQRAGHRVSVLTQARVEDPRPPLPDLDVVWFPWRRRTGRLAEMDFSSPGGALSALSLLFNGARGVAQMRKSRRVDVFLCAWVIPSGWYVWLDQVLGRGGVPYVLWALGSDVNKYRSNPFVRRALRSISARAAHLYADGFRLCEDLSEITGRECEFLPTFRTIRIPPPVEEERARVPRFLYVGRHIAVKGVDVLIEALVALEAAGVRGFTCEIVGEGELTPALKARVEAAGLSDRVRFPGRLDDADLYARYASCDCVVIPSRSESIPLVMSEALQARRPLIVTDVGDMGRLVREHRLGEAAPPEDPHALAASLRRFIEKPWALDAQGRTRLLEELMFESAAPRLLRRLEQAVAA